MWCGESGVGCLGPGELAWRWTRVEHGWVWGVRGGQEGEGWTVSAAEDTTLENEDVSGFSVSPSVKRP